MATWTALVLGGKKRGPKGRVVCLYYSSSAVSVLWNQPIVLCSLHEGGRKSTSQSNMLEEHFASLPMAAFLDH